MWPGGKEGDAASVETLYSGRKNKRSCVLKAGHVRVPVDAERRLTGVIRLARPGGIIDVARCCAIGWRATYARHHWLRLQVDRSCVRHWRAGRHNKDDGIDAGRCSSRKSDRFRICRRKILRDDVTPGILYKRIVIVCREPPRLVYEDLVLCGVVALGGDGEGGIDR